jgi:hypothetical protein
MEAGNRATAETVGGREGVLLGSNSGFSYALTYALMYERETRRAQTWISIRDLLHWLSFGSLGPPATSMLFYQLDLHVEWAKEIIFR